MTETTSPSRVLLQHFFRRFFDNDTLQVDGDTRTTIVRALAIVSAPGLMVAFFLQNQYPRRDMAGRFQDQYFFVLTTFVVMGLTTVFQWEMLFPDRADFLVLIPLPLRSAQLMVSKALALCGFMALFIMGSSLAGTVVYSGVAKGPFFLQFLAHGTAVTLAGTFIAAALIALGAGLRCLLSDRFFRMVTPLLQASVTAALVLLVVQYLRYGASLDVLLSQPAEARWLPPLWFLGLYDRILYGSAAPAFCRVLSPHALWGTAAAVLAAVACFPGAWARMRRMALEGDGSRRKVRSSLLAKACGRLRQSPPQRAMFLFIGQTMRRTSRYQAYLAIYTGAGVALAAACGSTLVLTPASLVLNVSNIGVHAVYPLLCFWLIAGLRTAFAFPVQLQARWIFRIAGPDNRFLARASSNWALASAFLLLILTLLATRMLGWNGRQLLTEAVFGMCLALLLTDAFFFVRAVPLTQPRLPGRTNFALLLTLYIGVLPPLLFAVSVSEVYVERHLGYLAAMVALAAGFHALVKRVHTQPMESEEEMEGYEGEIQLLHLS